jgi:hypothetical protein
MKEKIFWDQVPYLSAIGALMYLANCTRPDIAFAVNLLARHSAAPTKRHWTGVKCILRYLNGTRDLGLFYKRGPNSNIIGYTNAGYLSDPLNDRSQTGFMFLHNETTISWKSSKQTLMTTSTNHSEIVVLYEASRECVWLRRMINHIQQSCGIDVIDSPTIIYEDNTIKIIRLVLNKWIKDISKAILPSLFLLNCSILMNCNKREKSISCPPNHVITSLIYSLI